MLDRETFTKAINILKNYQEKEDRLYEAGVQIIDLTSEVIDCVLFLLKAGMKDETDLISYFCYDLNFGKNWCVGCVTEKDGTDIKLETTDDLYNVLYMDDLYRKDAPKQKPATEKCYTCEFFHDVNGITQCYGKKNAPYTNPYDTCPSWREKSSIPEI